MTRKIFALATMLVTLLISAVAFASYERTADNTVAAYTDPELRNRIGNERVDAGDRLIVFEERGNAYYVRYPVRNGTKDRWVPKNIFNGGANYAQPAEGDYYIVPENSGAHAIDVPNNSRDEGTILHIYSKNGSGAQIFTLRRVNNEWYKIIHKDSGLVINCYGGGNGNGTRLWLYHDDGTASCYWRFKDLGNGVYNIESQLPTNPYLEVQNGNPFNGAVLQLWQQHTLPAARWKLERVGAPAVLQGDVRTRLLNTIFGRSGGRISCDFDSYVNTPGRHEGIDMVLNDGAEIHAITSGIVTKAGGDRINTVAIYDPTNNKTVVYLHMKSLVGLYVNKQINKGDVIGHQGSTGASASHIHLEVRDGRREAAAKSVNDPTLDNSNPYSYLERVL